MHFDDNLREMKLRELNHFSRPILLLLLLLGLWLNAFSFQDQQKITTEQIDQIARKAFYLMYEDADEALILADSTLKMAKTIDYKKGIITAYYNIGSIYLTITDYQNAITNYEKSVSIAEPENCDDMLGKIYSALGIALDESGKTRSAIDYHFKALKISEVQQDTVSIADTYNNIGILFSSQDDHKQAISYYLKALNLVKNNKSMQPSTATYYSNLGDSYFFIGKKDSAQIFYEYALAIDTKYNDIEGLAYSNLSLGNIYGQNNKLDIAFTYVQTALVHATATGDRAQEVSVLNSLASLYQRKDELQKSLDVIKKSYKIAREINFPEGIRDALEIEADLQKMLGNYSEALEKLQKYHQFADSIQNEQKVKLLVRQQAEYDFAKERLGLELERERERIAFEIERENREAKQLLTNVGLALCAIIIMLILLFYYDKKKNNILLNEANVEILQLNENLELKIEERTKELVKRNKQLEEFAETNSHKVRHSIAQLLGITALFIEDNNNSDIDREEERRLIRLLRKSSKELDIIVKDIDGKLSS